MKFGFLVEQARINNKKFWCLLLEEKPRVREARRRKDFLFRFKPHFESKVKSRTLTLPFEFIFKFYGRFNGVVRT